MYRPTLDSCVRNQQPLNTQVHKLIHHSQSWAGSPSLSIHRDQHFLEGVYVVRVKILTNTSEFSYATFIMLLKCNLKLGRNTLC